MSSLSELGIRREQEPGPKRNVGLVFPGQGTQNGVPMLARKLWDKSPAARAIFERADDALGFSLSRMCLGGEINELNRTENAQPAVLTASVASLEALRERDPKFLNERPLFVAGHSLGEYTALVAADALGFDSAIRLVRDRGVLTQQRADETKGIMAVIIGLSREKIQELCEESVWRSGIDGVNIGNINDYKQIVVTGFRENVAWVMEEARKLRARLVKQLPVDGAFHSPLMLAIRDAYGEIVSQYKINTAKIPVVQNVNAQATRDPDTIRHGLVEHLYRPVLWVDSLGKMVENGVEELVECGPGEVLANMAKRSFPQLQVAHADTLQ